MEMIIQKRFKDPNDWHWFNITIEECLEKTEGTGYWKTDSVIKGLKTGLIINTPFAQYRCVEYIVDGAIRTNKF